MIPKLKQGPLNIWTEHSNCQVHSRVDSKTLTYSFTDTQYFLDFFMKLFSYAYKSWGHDPIWYFSCLCRKFSELRALLFLSSTQTSQNMKFIQKCPCLSSLKNKFQWTQKNLKSFDLGARIRNPDYTPGVDFLDHIFL